MDLNIILWLGGMLFTLMIFAIKVGVGLGLSSMRYRGVLLTLSLYLSLFVLIAMLSGPLITILEPVLKKGPYLHSLMAVGMIVWGIYLVQQCDSGTGNAEKTTALPHYRSAALLLIPCPVCLTAMTFSTWAALSVIKLPVAVVGLGLGVVFILLSLAVHYLLKRMTLNASLITQKIGLGLGMMAIGLYFVGSLLIPAKIEEARDVYESFLGSGTEFIEGTRLVGCLGILFVFVLLGYFVADRLRITR